MTIRQWSTTASGNANAASINWQEGQAPSTVNNSARELMAQIRQEYDPERWGWIAFSATVSVASQTTFKITGNQTDDYVANRKVKLTGGTATVYADILSASYTSETTVTIQNASGSLSNSMSIAWLSSVYGNNLPGNVLTAQSATFSSIAVLASASFSASVHFTGPVEFKGAFSVSGAAAFRESVSFSASAKFLGAVAFTGGATVTSATLSVAAGMLTVGGSPVSGGAAGGTTVLNNTVPTTAGATFSGSWSAYSAFEISVLHTHDPGVTSTSTTTLSVGVAVYSDGGTTPFLSGTLVKFTRSSTDAASVWTTVKVAGAGSTNVVAHPVSAFESLKGRSGALAQPTATTSSGALYVTAVRVWVAESSGTVSFSSTGRVIITGT